MSPPTDPPRAWWTCPECGFTFDAAHTNVTDGGYECPACAQARLTVEFLALKQGLWKLIGGNPL